MLKSFVVLVLMFVLGNTSVAQQVMEWTPAQVNAKIKANGPFTLLDVRTPEEFVEGHLPNALNIDVNGPDFEQKIMKLDKKKPVYVYCLAGGRSKTAASILKEKGFQAISMQGGIKAWKSAGLPVIKGR